MGSGAALAGAAQVIAALAGAVTGLVVARVLGPGATGAYTVVLSALLVLNAFGNLGIAMGVTYYVSRGSWPPGDAARHAQLAAIPLGLIGGLIGSALVLADVGGAFAGVPKVEGATALLVLPFLLCHTYMTALAVALERYEAYSFGFIGQALAALVLVVALAPTVGVGGAVLGLAGSYLITGAALGVWALRTTTPLHGWLERTAQDLTRATRFGVKAYLTSALQYLSQRADLLILNASASAATVGRYAVALGVTSLIFLLPRALSAVLLPRVAALDSRPAEDGQQEVAVKAVRHVVILTSATGLLLLGGVFAIPLVFGSDFEPAIVPGLLLLPGSAALGVGQVLWAAVTGKGRPEHSLQAALAITPPTLLLYLLVVPTLGASGAALVSSVSYTATAIAGLVFFQRLTGAPKIIELVPRRSDLDDYRALGIRAWTRFRQ